MSLILIAFFNSSSNPWRRGQRAKFVLRLNTSSVTMIICGLVEKSTVVVTKQLFDFWHAIGLREDVCK